MNKLVKTVLQRPVAVSVMVIFIVIFGIASLAGMKLGLTPDMDMPVVLIRTEYPNAGSEEVERLITNEIEKSCGTISGLHSISSESRKDTSVVTLSFERDTDMDAVFLEIQAAVGNVKASLPEGSGEPVILGMDMNTRPAMTLSVSADGNEDVLHYVNETLLPKLQRLPEVADIEVAGGKSEYISVELLPELMKQYKMDLATVAETVSDADFVTPVGSAEYGNQKLNVSSEAEYKTTDEIGSIPITTPSGKTLRLSDVAYVHYTAAESDCYSRCNSADDVSIRITKTQNADALALSCDVKGIIRKLQAEDQGITITTVYDTGKTVVGTVGSVAFVLALGILLTMAVLFLLFGDRKVSLIVGSSMLLSLMITFILMKIMGLGVNMLTMGAWMLGIAMMADNAIAVMETCFRKNEEDMPLQDAVFAAIGQVLPSVVMTAVAVIVVYSPFIVMKGLTGQVYGQFGWTILFVLAASLVSSILLVPLFFSKYKPVETKRPGMERFLNAVNDKYIALLKKVLQEKSIVVIPSVVIFVLSIVLFLFVKAEPMPQSDEGTVAISIAFRPGTQSETMDAKVREIEAFVEGSEYIDDYSAKVEESLSCGTVEAYVSDYCLLSSKRIANKWERALQEYEDNCEITVTSVSAFASSHEDHANTYEVTFESRDLDKLREACIQVTDAVAGLNGVTDATHSMADTEMRAEIVIDPIRAAVAGVTPAYASGQVYSMMNGIDALHVLTDEGEYIVTVEYPKDEYATVNAVYGMMLGDTEGAGVPLSDIAEIVYSDSPISITRKDGMYTASLIATLKDGITKNDVRKNIQDLTKNSLLPDGVSRVRNTTDDIMMEEVTSLILAIVVALLLTYVVITIRYENLKYPGIIMLCIPLSVIVSVGLMLTAGCSLNMISLTGFLILIGMVISNGIRYVDEANHLCMTMSMEEALAEAGKSRLCPVLMTAFVMFAALLPLALGVCGTGELTQGLAIVICGGLITNTMLTLLVLPAFYKMISLKQ